MDECIAVIVPVYNVEGYIGTCIESILKQSYQNLDIILVDDGSTDGSYEICRRYANQDGRVKAFHKENGGILSAKCLGMEHTEADYVMFVDADDWIKPEMCDSLYNTMKHFCVDIVASGIIRALPDGTYKYDYNLIPEGEYRGEEYKKEIIPHMLCNGCFFRWGIDPSTAIKIFKRDKIYPIVKNAAGFGFYYGEDTAIVYPYLLQAQSIYVLGQCFYYHRQYENRRAFYIDDPDYGSKNRSLYCYLKDIFMLHDQREALMRQLDYFYAYTVYQSYLQEVEDVIGGFHNPLAMSFLFPFGKINKGSRVLLYGAGDVGKIYYRQLMKSGYCSEIIWVDRRYEEYQKQSLPVQSPDVKEEADYYIIAIANQKQADDIKSSFLSQGIEEGKVIWENPYLYLW